MSRGNYYYAREWVGGPGGFANGGIDRIEDWESITVFLLVLGVLVSVATAISQIIPMGMFLSLVPVFYLAVTVAIIAGVLSASEEGALFVLGWTFVSLLLLGFGLINIWEGLLDLVPVAILILQAVN